eukprot:GHVS01090868.1.p1 GENE.GHVS01090868.1~~GHVS01090868.1.p1  ORF type:complete len:688 (-),score=68.02 GHVS01090868.1:658-2721(-)
MESIPPWITRAHSGPGVSRKRMAVRSADGRGRHLSTTNHGLFFSLVLFTAFHLIAILDSTVAASTTKASTHEPAPSISTATSSPSQLEQINLNLRSLSSPHLSSHDLPSVNLSREVHAESASPPGSVSNRHLVHPKTSELLPHSALSSSSPPPSHGAATTDRTHNGPAPALVQVEAEQSASSPARWLVLVTGVHMVSHKLLALALQAAAVLSSVAMQLTPSPTILSVSKSRSTGDLEPLPYVMLLLSATLWTIYGVFKSDLIIALPNLIGIVLGIVYVYTYRKHCTNAVHRYCLNFYIKISAVVVVALALVTLFGGLHRGTTVAGLSAAFFNVISYAAPLSSLGQVLRDKSTASMPYEMSVGSLICSILWMIYGFVISDKIILIPSLIGAFVGCMQLALLIAYPSKTGFEPLMGRTDLSCCDTFRNAAAPAVTCGYDGYENLSGCRPGGYMTADDVYGAGGEGERKASTTLVDGVRTEGSFHQDTLVRSPSLTGMRYLADVVRGPWRANEGGNGSKSSMHHDSNGDHDPCIGLGEDSNTGNIRKTEAEAPRSISSTHINLSPTRVDTSVAAPLGTLSNVATPSTTGSGYDRRSPRSSSVASSPTSNHYDPSTSFAGSLVGYIFPQAPCNRMSHRFSSKVGGHAGIVVPSICDTSGNGLPTHDTLLKHVFGQSADLPSGRLSRSQATR